MRLTHNAIAIAAVIAAFFLIKLPLSQANAAHDQANPQRSFPKNVSSSQRDRLTQSSSSDSEADIENAWDEAPEIRATRRISIPYGFDTPLPVLADGRDVLASGHGGCTEDQQVTVAITMTQSTSNTVATGEKEQTCTGELQLWSLRVTADTTSSFETGPAEACGLATTRDGGYVTDTYDWCVDVALTLLDRKIYLPAILGP